MNVEEAQPSAGADAAEPKPKRPRVGRPHSEILGTIDADAECTSEKEKHIRRMLLQIGEARFEGDEAALPLIRQANEIANSYESHPQLVLDLLLEAVLNLPQYAPWLACAASIVHRKRNNNFMETVVEYIHGHLINALNAGHPVHARLLLRFLASLAIQGSVASADVVEQLLLIIDAAEDCLKHVTTAEGSAVFAWKQECMYYVRLALGTLPWVVDDPTKGRRNGLQSTDTANEILQRTKHIIDTVESDAALHPAGSAARQGQLESWLDIPAEAINPTLTFASRSDTAKLHVYLSNLLSTEASLQAWAVPEVARPHWDHSVQDILKVQRGEGEGDEDKPPVRFYSVFRFENGKFGPKTDDAEYLEGRYKPGTLRVPSFETVHAASRHFVRPSAQLFGEGGLSATPAVYKAVHLSDSSSLGAWALRDLCHDILALYHPFHSETSIALLTIPLATSRPKTNSVEIASIKPSSPLVVSLAVEACITELLWMPRSPFATPFYTMVLVNLLASDAATTPTASNTIGLAARVLWKNMNIIDDVMHERLASWISHHISIAKWTWMWDEWIKVLDEGTSSLDAQHRFLQRLLQHTFALLGTWHHARVVKEKFPPILQERKVLPADPANAAVSRLMDAVDSREAAASSSPSQTNAHVDFAAQCMNKLQSKATDEEMVAWINEYEKLSGNAKLAAFSELLFFRGKANYQNVKTLLERYRSGLMSGINIEDEVARPELIIGGAYTVWTSALHIVGPILHLLIDSSIVKPRDMCAYHLRDHHADGLLMANFSWVEHVHAIHDSLDRAATIAARDAIEVALYRGAKVYDIKEDEKDLDEALTIEDGLVRKAEASATLYEDAVQSTFSSLCALIAEGMAAGSGPAAARIALAHLREICRVHIHCLQSGATYFLDSTDFSNGSASVAALVSAARLYSPSRLVVPSPLLRDRDVPQPDHTLRTSKLLPT